MQTIEVPVKDYVRMHEADQLLQSWAKRQCIKKPGLRQSLAISWTEKVLAFCEEHDLFQRKRPLQQGAEQ